MDAPTFGGAFLEHCPACGALEIGGGKTCKDCGALRAKQGRGFGPLWRILLGGLLIGGILVLAGLALG